MTRRRLGIALTLLVALGSLAWHYQSKLIGFGAGWYLSRVAASENGSGDLTKRRAVVAGTHRMLLMPPPQDALVPELFDLVTALAARSAAGSMSMNWSAYVYTSYFQDMMRERPTGEPARTPEQVAAEVERYAQFYALQQRPDVPGVRVSDLLGDSGDSYTLEEIEKAEKEGHPLPLK